MIKNFIVDADLDNHYPNITDYLPSTLSDWQYQINEAFGLVLMDLRSRELDVREMGLPLDLKRAATSTSDQNVLTSSVEAISTTSTHIKGRDGFRRFALNVTARSGTTTTIALQGSNDLQITDSDEPTNWTAITSLTPTTTGESSIVVDEQYRFYRIVSTITSASITYTAALYEVYFDIWTIYKTFWLIFTYLAKTPDDVWSDRAKKYESLYGSTLTGYKFVLDSDDNNQVEDEDELSKSGQRRLSR